MNQTAGKRRALWALTVWSVLGSVACAPPPPAGAVSAGAALQQAPDGDLVVTAPLTVLNRYGRLGVAATHGDKQIVLSAAQDLTDLNLQPGDLLMVVQTQGAQIQAGDTDQYGVVTAPGGAGRFEFIAVAAVDATANRVVLDATCGGLRNDYDPAGRTQVIRVPQYASLTVNTGASVVGLGWSGAVGGVVAVRAQQTLTVHGEISASGQGFRGGAAQTMGTAAADQLPDQAGFAYGAATSGGAKGESIAGFTAQYASGFGRGAPANGGGGGNAFKAGGGGGAGAGVTSTWTGQGVMPNNVTGATAWMLDPAYLAANSQLTTSSGGGRGGYSAATASRDPLVVPPGDATWLGNLRRERGGRGGHPLAPEAATRLFLGGGGGAGDQNGVGAQATHDGAGGAGGGLVYLVASTMQGDGRITASGAAGSDSGAGSGAAQGAGGGGGGGAIVLNAGALRGTLSIEASGGAGGRHLSAGVGIGDTNGPGGGGGGGFIAAPATVDTSVTRSVRGGIGGTSASSAMTSFPSSGATSGGAGTQQSLTQLAAAPLCTPADLTVSVSAGQTLATAGDAVTFTVVVKNQGPYDVAAAELKAALSPSMTAVAWSCASSDPDLDAINCADAAGTNVGDIDKYLTLPVGASVQFTEFVNLVQGESGTLTYQATVTPPSNVPDLLPLSNTASATTLVSNPADVQVQLLAAPNPSLSGEAITVTATVRNVGPSTATGLQLTLQLPVSGQIQRQPAGPGWTCAAVDPKGLVTCQNPALAAGAESEVWLAILPDFDATALAVSAAVTSASSDPDSTNNAAAVMVPITFNAASYRTPAIGGGGFGCALSGSGAAPPPGAAWLFLGSLGLWARRRRAAAYRNLAGR